MRSYERVAAVERRHGAGRHVAELQAVAGLVLRVDGEREQLAVLAEREVAHVADVELHAFREVAQDQIGAARPLGAPPPAARARAARAAAGRAGAAARAAAGRVGAVALQRDPARRLAREGEAPDLRVLLLLAGREVHHRHARLDRPALPLQPLRRRARRIRRERDPLPVVRERERGRGAAGRRRRGRRRAAGATGRHFADREAHRLVGADRLHDDLGVPFLRREPVAEPLAVVRQHRGAEGLPRDDVLDFDGALRRLLHRARRGRRAAR